VAKAMEADLLVSMKDKNEKDIIPHTYENQPLRSGLNEG
jgi:hypothetical protein